MAYYRRSNYRKRGSSRSYGRTASAGRSRYPSRGRSTGRRSSGRATSARGKQVVEVRLVTEHLPASPGTRNIRVLQKMNPPSKRAKL